MRADIVIPAFNEGVIIEETLRETVAALETVPFPVRIIVADNASTDATAEAARSVEGIDVLYVPERGKGAAVRAAARLSTAELFGFLDADLSAHPREFLRLASAMETEGTDIAIGSRLHEPRQVRRSFLRTLSSRTFNLIRRILLGITVYDTQCGLKLMNEKGRELLASCEETGWFFDIELLAKAEKVGLRVSEVPVPWEEFRYEGRKSKLNVLYDGWGGIQAMLRIRARLKQ